MKKLISIIFALVSIGLLFPNMYLTQEMATDLNKSYMDESHCLIAPEIRNRTDKPISCYCKDALTEARYVYQTYLITGKDKNLNGIFLTLETQVNQMCGESYDGHKAITTKEWKWNGPEVERKYPADDKIQQIMPDSNGYRTVKYSVRLTYHDNQGHVTKTENFTAADKLPSNKK